MTASADHSRKIKALAETLRQHPAFQQLVGALRERAEYRVRAAIGATENVEVLRGRAQEMLAIINDLET